MACLVLFAASSALADPITILDTTLTQRWVADTAYDWATIIGEIQFDIKKAVITRTGSEVLFQIYTNLPSTGLSVNNVSVPPADLYLTGANGVVGVVMYAHDGYRVGDLVSNPTWKKAQDFWGDGRWYYGGRYDQASPKVTYTQVASGSVTGSVPVTWTNLGLDQDQGVDTFRIDIQHFQNVLAGDYSFFWGTGTCANDAFAGNVYLPSTAHAPLPSTMLLLGSALAALVFWRPRKLTKSA